MRKPWDFIGLVSIYLFCCYVILAPEIAAQVVQQDSMAIIALYDSTNGDNWNNNNGWKNGLVSTWYGIGITGNRVTSINLAANNLTGKLPPEIGDLSELTILYINNNVIGDTLPSQIGNLSSMWELKLDHNQFHGTIPAALGNLSSVITLYLQYNAFSGSIPNELGRLSTVRYLDLSYNQLTGNIPDSLGNLHTVTTLNLSNNQLEGTIPVSLGNITNIAELVLHNNRLTGSIPSSLGNVNMQSLVLSGNQLTGSIPGELGNIANLLGLYLQDNQLTGSIPSNLFNLNNLLRLDLSNNQISGTISAELANMTSLDRCYLNKNQLTGSIPPALGNARQIRRIWLNDNQLGDSIPTEFVNHNRLEELYLQNNIFSHMPDLSAGNISSGIDFKVENNFLDFEDLEPNANLSSDFTYSPQAPIGDLQNKIQYAGDSLTIGVNAGGTASIYHWFKDSIEIHVSSDTFLVLNNIQIHDDAEYYCSVTNNMVPDLILNSHPFTLSVIDTTAPSIPQGLSAAPGDKMVTLHWRQNDEPDSVYYRIYMSTTPQPSILIDSTNSIDDTTKALTGLNNNTTYYIRLTAVDWSNNESGFSDQVQATPIYIDSIPPGVPQNLFGVGGDGSVTLTWNSVIDTGYIYYRIYMDTKTNPLILVDSTANFADTSITITNLVNNTEYYFRVTAIDDFKNESDFSNEILIIPMLLDITGNTPELPESFSLGQNYPNPFNPITTIRYGLPQASHVKLEIFDLLGRQVAVLVDGKMQAGYHEITIESNELSSGIYLYRIAIGKFCQVKKMIVLQ